MRRTRSRLLSARLLAPALAASLVLAGCGGDEKDEPEAAESPTAAPEPETWPLTGLEAPAGESVDLDHPAMVLKLDNTAASAPQLGLGSADLVVEELVEGGMTRLAVFYYSQLPGDVGPVRSMRASDIGIVSPANGAMVTSGAAPVTIDRIKKAGITFFGEGAKGFRRDDARRAPYNLLANMKQVATAIKEETDPPANYLPWGTAEELPQGQPAAGLAASFSGGHTTNWVFENGKYVNQNSYAKEGDEFPADTVLVLKVDVGDAGYKDPAGNPVPETKLEGKGQAMLFHGGNLVRGTWEKSGLDQAITLSTKAGELMVPAGHTWIELVPKNGGNVTVQK